MPKWIYRKAGFHKHGPANPAQRGDFAFRLQLATTPIRRRPLAKKSGRRSGNVVTIHDVARHAGVSLMTVSRVVNGESNVREVTRAKVASSIKILRYSPNLAARSLASADAVHIGLLYSNPSSAYLREFLLGS